MARDLPELTIRSTFIVGFPVRPMPTSRRIDWLVQPSSIAWATSAMSR
jgi:hypothetical protein